MQPRALCALLLWRAGEAGNTVDCIKNTGGTCARENCFEWRGPTSCESTFCTCTPGTCTGSDGVCTDVPYEAVGRNTSEEVYRIRNTRWPDKYVDIDMSGTVGYAKECDGDDCKFTLSMPTYEGGEQPLSAPLFLIKSVRWPTSTMMVTQSDGSGGGYDYDAVVYNVDSKLIALGTDPTMNATSMILTLAPETSPEGNTPLMLSSPLYPDRYLYIAEIGLTVETYHDDPGAGGYWFFEPRLPEEVRAKLLSYSGPRCSFSCGDVAETVDANAAAADAASLPLLAAIAVAFATAASA